MHCAALRFNRVRTQLGLAMTEEWDADGVTLSLPPPDRTAWIAAILFVGGTVLLLVAAMIGAALVLSAAGADRIPGFPFLAGTGLLVGTGAISGLAISRWALVGVDVRITPAAVNLGGAVLPTSEITGARIEGNRLVLDRRGERPWSFEIAGAVDRNRVLELVRAVIPGPKELEAQEDLERAALAALAELRRGRSADAI